MRHHQGKARNFLKPYLHTLKNTILIAFATLGFIGLIWHEPNIEARKFSAIHLDQQGQAALVTTAPSHSCDCGKSVEEALYLGCKYDSLAAGWLPEHCRDDQLTDEFNRSGPGVNGSWTYWADRAHTQEISPEYIASMGGDPDFRFYSSGLWHAVHCIFYWRKEFRQRVPGKVVEPRYNNEEHATHCGKVFLDQGHNSAAGVALNG